MTDDTIDECNEIIERADYIEDSELEKKTVHDNEYFQSIHSALLDKGTVLLQGPRGSGKTHLMKYTWLLCKENEKYPLCLYVTFNKYFFLEPLLKVKPNAIALFNTWCLTKILISTYELIIKLLEDKKEEEALPNDYLYFSFSKKELEDIIIRLEQGLSPTNEQEKITTKISVSSITNYIEQITKKVGRKRTIILLDDAAMSLTPEYLYEFFDIVRTLKTPRISLKASVYPGTTEYGPKFHVAHEAKVISAWLDIQNPQYSTIFDDIAKLRFEKLNQIDRKIVELLKYASFGIPRSFLIMLREFSSSNNNNTNQQRFNHTINLFCNVRVSEYLSLRNKMPRLENIIKYGQMLFDKIITKTKEANTKDKKANTKQVIFGIEEYGNLLADRMIELLIEVGLLFPIGSISHGKNKDGSNRTYKRYIPHYAFLLNVKAFSENSRGFRPNQILQYINRNNTKHPVRANLKNLLGKEVYTNLHLNLPACTKCGTPRNNDIQKFCGNCGSQLIDGSVFNKCMEIPLHDIPSLTDWQKTKIQELKIMNVGEFITLPDPGSELRKIRRIGRIRAEKIIKKVSLHIDEYLS